MSSHRATIVALVAVFTVAMTSLASACCVSVESGHTNSPNPVPLAPAPIYVDRWSNSWSSDGCGRCGVAPWPFYLGDQGPDFTGPGITRHFVSYTPPVRFAFVSPCCGYRVAITRQPPLVRK